MNIVLLFMISTALLSPIQDISGYIYTNDLFLEYEDNSPFFYYDEPKEYHIIPPFINSSNDLVIDIINSIGFILVNEEHCNILIQDENVSTEKNSIFFNYSNDVTIRTINWKNDPLLLNNSKVTNTKTIGVNGTIIATYEDDTPAIVQKNNLIYVGFSPTKETLTNIIFLFILEKNEIPLSVIIIAAGSLSLVAIFLSYKFYEKILISLTSGILFIIGQISYINKEEVLENDIRRAIYNFIMDNPGSYLREIKREFGVSINTTIWHLRVLEHANLIKYKKFSNRLYYFASGLPQKEYIEYLLLKNDKLKIVTDYLRSGKKAHLRKIARDTNLHPQTVKHYLEKLFILDMVEETETNNKIIYSIISSQI